MSIGGAVGGNVGHRVAAVKQAVGGGSGMLLQGHSKHCDSCLQVAECSLALSLLPFFLALPLSALPRGCVHGR